MLLFKPIRDIAALTILAISASAAAQTPATPAAGAKTGKAVLMGVVVDSLNGGFLSGADVIIAGAKKVLTTDSLGRFSLDSLTPGMYQIGIFHPLLDTLGVSLATKPFHIGPDSTSFVTIAVPSASTLIRSACRVNPRAQGNSAVIGHVQNAETLEPVAGAEVSLAWMQMEVSKQVGVRRTPRLLHDSTDASGAFHICGLPKEMTATLQARRGSSVTAEVPITLSDGDSELFARTLLLSAADSTATVGNAAVSGRVVLEGTPVGTGTRVELLGTDKVTTTNEKGEFAMANLPSGTRVLLARHIGFGAQTVPVDLSSREPKRVTISLPKFVATMAPVLVTARRAAALDQVGFTHRQRSGSGYFLGPDQLQRMNPTYLTDVLRQIPGLRISYSSQGEVVTSSRGGSLTNNGCVQYFVDRMPWQSMTPGDINQFVNGREIAAVEVYQGPGTPAEYTIMNGCATIVLWTRTRIRD